MALFLRDAEVHEAVSMDDMLRAIEDMQRRYGIGEDSNLARRNLVSSSGLLSVMGGGLYYRGVFGVKSYTVAGDRYSFHLVLYDASTGQLLAFLQANRLGLLRTGATTGVAVKYLTNQDAKVVGIFGTGHQASSQRAALCSVRKVSEIKAYSRTADSRALFAQHVSNKLGTPVVAVDSGREVVEGNDVVVCITNSMELVLQGHWLEAGTLLASAGPATWQAREVDDASTLRASRIVVDSLEQAPAEAGELACAADKGLIRWSQIVELRHVVAGFSPGRTTSDEINYAKLMGTGIADVAAAKLAYDMARQKGVGTEMES